MDEKRKLGETKILKIPLILKILILTKRRGFCEFRRAD